MAQPDRQAWREGAMTPIGSILERNIILNGADVLTAKGYTQVPNHVLVSDRLSPGAKLTYAMLLKYAWQNDSCFPGQERLAKDMGVTDRSVRTYLQELEREQFVGRCCKSRMRSRDGRDLGSPAQAASRSSRLLTNCTASANAEAPRPKARSMRRASP